MFNVHRFVSRSIVGESQSYWRPFSWTSAGRTGRRGSRSGRQIRRNVIHAVANRSQVHSHHSVPVQLFAACGIIAFLTFALESLGPAAIILFVTVSYNRYLILLIVFAQLDVRAHTRVLALTGRRTRGLFLGFAHDIYIKMQPINKFFQSIFNEHVIDGQQTQFQYVFKPSEIRQETVGDL